MQSTVAYHFHTLLPVTTRPTRFCTAAADDSLEVPFTGTKEAWESWVTKINQALNPLDLEFAHMNDQATGKELYALVCRTLVCRPY